MKHPKEHYYDKLTIVLPLLNRENLTVRYLRYLESTHFPFQVLIADGGSDAQLEEALRLKLIAPKVRYTYVRFPPDATLSDFYLKNKKSMELVKTPYMMFNCNDDIPVVSGLCELIDFLDVHPAYAAASGKIGGFSVIKEQQKARLCFYECCYEGGSVESFEQETGLERICHQLIKSKSCNLYYGIQRSAAAKRISHDLEILNFNDLLLHETYWIGGLLAMGKIKVFDNIFTYFRQRETSFSAPIFLKRWYYNVLFDNWLDQVDRFVVALSTFIAEDQKEQQALEEIRRVLQNALSEGILQLDIAPSIAQHRWQKVRLSEWYTQKIRNAIRKVTLYFWENNRVQAAFLQLTEYQKVEVEGIIKHLEL